MFTGIIKAIGKIHQLDKSDAKVFLQVDIDSLDINDVEIGDSVAVNGACLTVVHKDVSQLGFDVSNETMCKTNFADLHIGDYVNLEKAMQLNERLHGHLVTGHVDGVGELSNIVPDGECYQWKIQFPNILSIYIATKGSITINGVSLTVNQVEHDCFWINIIRHTMEHTNFQYCAIGSKINLEIDLIARYLKQMIR